MKLKKQIITQFLTFILMLFFSFHSQWAKAKALQEDTFVKLFEKVNPAVVNIFTYTKVPKNLLTPLLPRFYSAQPRASLGTGFIIRKDGLIVTNAHVVDKANQIKVQLAEEGKEFTANLIGGHKRSDIALLKIKSTKNLPIAVLGDSSKLKVGQWVAALGNPYGHQNTISKGIISGLGRDINELNQFPLLQTDTAINPGNSGGPLVDTNGYVIGVNSAIDARAQGIGFAIPVNNIKPIIVQLEKHGSIQTSFLGIYMVPLTIELGERLGLKPQNYKNGGVVISQIVLNSPAHVGGLLVYDTIVSINEKKVSSPKILSNIILDTPPNKTISMTLYRNGRKLVKKIKLNSRSNR